jgi:hypothetical protein
MPAATRPQNPLIAAFTLIEMAIVITIIGLVVGGIILARSYLDNSQMNAMMTESRYYINAFSQFQSLYHAVPGDMATADQVWGRSPNCGGAIANGTCPGDGNGQILSSANAGAGALPEVFYAFQHLALAGLISGNYTGRTAGGVGTLVATAGVNVPAGAFSGTAYLFDHPDFTDGNVTGADPLYFSTLYFHVLKVAALPANSLPTGAFLTPAQALELDTKYDDGKPGTGWITTPKRNALANCASNNNSATATYATNGTKQACYFILKIQ